MGIPGLEGVYRFDGTGWQKVGGISGPAFDIAFAADGTPWVATTGGMHYPGGSLSYREGDQWIDASQNQGLHSFAAIALGPGSVVAASTQLGLGVYEGGAWSLLKDGPTSHRVTSVAVTPDGTAWLAFGDQSVSTPGWGLSRFDGQKWDYYLDNAEVNVLPVAPDGSLWVGVGCSVQRFDGATWETVGQCEDLPIGSVLDISPTPDGVAWVATGFGLARFDGQSWTLYEKLINSLEVAPDGSIGMNGWEGTEGSQYVARFDGETWDTFKSADSFPSVLIVRGVTSGGLVWGITPEGKLISYDSQSWRLYETCDGLSQDYVAPLGVAPDGTLWVSTDGAIARFDRGSPPGQAWTIYTTDDGLPDMYYRAMAFAPDGAVWFGATRFQPWVGGAK